MKRRHFIQKSALLSAAATLPAGALFSSPSNRSIMGFAVTSYGIRWKSDHEAKAYPGFQNAIDLLEHSHSIGAGGIQVGVGGWTKDFSGKVRDRREQLDMYLEGQINLPKDVQDIDRFEKDIKAGKEAGAKVIRTACLHGRRYENFDSLQAFLDFKKKAIQSIEWAEPMVRKHQVKLAVENHKDWTYSELIDLMKRFDSEWIGVTLDTGNNISFMEDNRSLIEALAPYAYTTHIKDMAYKKYEQGFLLSEVPLGEGVVDLKHAIRVIKQHQPNIAFNLEMITRDPLKVPCLTDGYWETFDQIPSGKDMARILRTAKEPTYELPTTSDKDGEARLAFEEENNVKSLKYAKENLGL